MTTTDDNVPATDLELDRLAWNIPAPRDDGSERRRPWPPWPFRPLPEDDPDERRVEPEQAA